MKKSQKMLKSMFALTLIASIALASSHSILAQDLSEESSDTELMESVESEDTVGETSTMSDHATMEHDDEGRLPGGIKIKREPTHKVGDDVIILNGHMPGMEGAEAVIVAAFETTAYEISYTPTDGSEAVNNHRWIVHEEITDNQEELYEVGNQITIDAYHMMGMEGATATIDAMTTQTVYLVDYVDTETGELIINHKWMVEEEIMAVEGEDDEDMDESSVSLDGEESSVEESSDEESSEESSTDSSESESSEPESSSEESESESESESDPV